MKKQQKKKLKRKLLIGFMLFSAILIIFLSNTTNTTTERTNIEASNERIILNPSSAGYISSIDIDCINSESAYEQVIDRIDYNVWYANNDSRHFIFMNSTNNLSGMAISIYSDDFNYDLTPEHVQTLFLVAYHVNYTMEFEIERSLIGNDFSLSIDTDIIELQVEPQTRPASKTDTPPPVVVEEEGEKEVIRLGIIEGWIYDLDKMTTVELVFWCIFWISAFWIFVFFIVREHNLLFKNPIVVTGNTVPKKIWDKFIPKKQRDIDDTGKEADYGKDIIKLGRYLTERESRILPGYFEFFFKHGKRFILTLHCKVRYDDVKGTRRRDVNIIQREHWEYETTLLHLPEELQPDEVVVKNTFRNKVLRYIARRFPSKRLPMKIDEKLERERTERKVKHVIIWEYIYDKEYIGFTADVKYKRKVPTERDPDATEDVPPQKEGDPPVFLNNVAWHEIELLMRDPMVILDKENDITNIKVSLIPVDKKFRDHFKNSASMERSKRAYLDSIYLKELKKLNDEIEQLTLENLNLEKEFKLKFIDAIKNFFKERIPSYSEFLGDILPEYKISGTIENTKEKALLLAEHREKIRKLDNKIASLENPSYVKDLEAQLKQAHETIETLQKGDGRSKKDKDLFDELGIIQEKTEGEE